MVHLQLTPRYFAKTTFSNTVSIVLYTAALQSLRNQSWLGDKIYATKVSVSVSFAVTTVVSS